MQAELIDKIEKFAPLSGQAPSMNTLARRHSPSGWWRFAISSIAAACVLLVVVWHLSWQLLDTPWQMPSEMVWLQSAVWACLGIGLVLLLLYAMHRPKSLRFNEQGLFISTGGVDGCTLERYVAWHWLSEATLVDYGFIIKEPRLQFRTKCSGTYSISLKQARASLSQDALLGALKRWAPNLVPEVEKYFDKEESSRFTDIWLQGLSGGGERAQKRQYSGELLPGMRLLNGKYEINCLLGRGGQGTAYLITDLSAGNTDKVLKEYIFPACNSSVRAMQARLQGELDIMHSVSHPNVVAGLECFVEDFRAYMVLEYVAGQTLKSLVENGVALSEREAVTIALQIADALVAVHGASPNVVHGDLTPDNIVRQADGLIKVLDFHASFRIANPSPPAAPGAVEWLDEGSPQPAIPTGKHAYIAPEQFRGNASLRSDIYALGATLHFMLTGEEPVPITTSHPRESNSEISHHLDEIVARATEFDETLRYQSILTMRDDLKTFLANHKTDESQVAG